MPLHETFDRWSEAWSEYAALGAFVLLLLPVALAAAPLVLVGYLVSRVRPR